MCIRKSKGHHQRFIESTLFFEGCFPLVTFSDSNLVVSISKINHGNTLEACNSSCISASLGMGYLYLIVILLMTLQSTTILSPPSFLGTTRAGTAHRLKDSHIKPFSFNSSTCLWVSMVSFAFSLYAGLFGRMELGISTRNKINVMLNVPFRRQTRRYLLRKQVTEVFNECSCNGMSGHQTFLFILHA